MTPDNDSITVTARCLCRAHVFACTAPRSSLPLIASLCHCDSCRYQTGALYFGCTTWPNKHEDLSSLKRYEFSPNTDLYACQTCSSQLFCRATRLDEGPEVITSALTNEPGLVEYGSHIFVGDTIDGGASMWFRHDAKGRELKRWAGHRERSAQLEVGWADQGHQAEMTTTISKSAFTPLQCHCKGVSFFLRSGAHLDQATPGTSVAELANELKESGFEMQSGRYPGFLCACNSCRMDVSSDITFWAAVPLACIYAEASKDVDVLFRTTSELEEAFAGRDGRLSTLKRYRSSPGVIRYACSVCSASVFAANTKKGDTRVVDLALGVLHHRDGARAESLLTWTHSRIDFASDGHGGWREDLVHAALEQAKARRER